MLMSSSKETLWRLCPECGRFVHAERKNCDCGYSFQTDTIHSVRPHIFGLNLLCAILLVVFCFFAFLILSNLGAFDGYAEHANSAKNVPTPTISASATPAPTSKPTPPPTPVEIFNGRILHSPSYEGQCPFSISVPFGSGGYYIFLQYQGASPKTTEDRVVKDSSVSTLKSDIAFYVAAGCTVEIEVPVGVYKFFYAHGETWYGVKYKFGENTLYYSSDDLLEFYIDNNYCNGHSIQLWEQTNGNFDTDTILESAFPD